MADSYVTVPNAQNIDTASFSINGVTVQRQRVILGDPTTATYYASVSAFGELSVTGKMNSLLEEVIMQTKRVARLLEILTDTEVTISDAD